MFWLQCLLPYGVRRVKAVSVEYSLRQGQRLDSHSRGELSHLLFMLYVWVAFWNWQRGRLSRLSATFERVDETLIIRPNYFYFLVLCWLTLLSLPSQVLQNELILLGSTLWFLCTFDLKCKQLRTPDPEQVAKGHLQLGINEHVLITTLSQGAKSLL